MKLYIANKNYSSWSLRVWLILKNNKISFEEYTLKLETDMFVNTLKEVAPIAKVPVIIDNQQVIWDSLAIAEYINETYLSGHGWPRDPALRAQARCLASEVHAGFQALKQAMPMNIRARRKVDCTQQVLTDIKRVEQIWTEQSQRFTADNDWLFGQWGIVDAMFAPIALRFQTYGVNLNADAQKYMNKVLACKALNQWINDALKETDIVKMDEAGEDV